MPSRAFLKFENRMLKDVDKLIESHEILSTGKAGRQHLGHITRSGIFMLCAAWELYVEELACEIAGCLADFAEHPNDLPLDVKKELAKMVTGHKHELKSLELAGDGWKGVYQSHVHQLTGSLNTPKSAPVDDLYLRLVGWLNPSETWTWGAASIDEFVKSRGDIAHRGSEADYVTIASLKSNREGVIQTATDHDNAACDFIYEHTGKVKRPWKRRYA